VRRLAAAAILCLAAVGLAACGGDSGGSSSGPAKITVQDTAGVPSSFVALGVHKGFFKREKLDVKVSIGQGGAAIIPAVVSGKVQIGGANLVSSLLASSKHLPIQVVAPGTFAPDTTRRDFVGIVVRKDSPIRTAKQLEGKSLAVNTLKNVNDVTDRFALAKRGADPRRLRFTELELPEMTAALASNRIAAATVIEPFLTQALGAGDRLISRPYVETRPGLEVGAYVAGKSYIASHADVVKRFQAGMRATAAYVTEHQAEMRAFLTKTGGIKRSLAKRIVLPTWKGRVDLGSLRLYATLMQRYGLTKERPSPEDAVASLAR
jgi:NitT/TauT family transport system substrate-binding protein